MSLIVKMGSQMYSNYYKNVVIFVAYTKSSLPDGHLHLLFI